MQFLSRVKFEGKLYEAGEELPKGMSKSVKARLQELGAIGNPPKSQPEPEEVEEDEGSDADESEDKPLSRMNKEELLAAAEEAGLDVDESMTNKELAAAIREASN